MTTFWADSAGSQGTGDGSSAANACTLKQALEDDAVLHTSLAAGDTIYCKNGTEITYDSSVADYCTITTAGTRSNPICVIGYASTVDDGGVVEIRDTYGSSVGVGAIVMNVDGWLFAHFHFTDCRRGIQFGSAADGCHLYDCEFTDSKSQGVNFAGSSSYMHSVVGCKFSGGSYAIVGSSRFISMIGCTFLDGSSGNGHNLGSYTGPIIDCVSYGSHSSAYGFGGSGSGVLWYGCASVGDGSGGGFNFSRQAVLVNCIAASGGGYGVQGSTGAGSAILINSNLNPTGLANTSGEFDGTLLTKFDCFTDAPSWADDSPADYEDVDLTIANTDDIVGLGISFAFGLTVSETDPGPCQSEIGTPAAANSSTMMLLGVG